MATIDLTKRDQVPIRSVITGDEEITTVVGSTLYVMNVQTILDAATPSVVGLLVEAAVYYLLERFGSEDGGFLPV